MKKKWLFCLLMSLLSVTGSYAIDECYQIVSLVSGSFPQPDDISDESGEFRPPIYRFQAFLCGNVLYVTANADIVAQLQVKNNTSGEVIVDNTFTTTTSTVIPTEGSYTLYIYSDATTVSGQFEIFPFMISSANTTASIEVGSDSIATKISHFEDFVSNIQEVPVSPDAWLHTWHICEWQRLLYMPDLPSDDNYIFVQSGYMLTIWQEGTDFLFQIGIVDRIVRAPWSGTNHISIPSQQIPDVYGFTETISGDVYLVNDVVYIRLIVLGSQHYYCESFGCNYKDFDTRFMPSAVVEVPCNTIPTKVVSRGQLFILQNGKQYNAEGVQ